jgi:hypothetical protein
MFSISGVLNYIGYPKPKGVARAKGPWVLACIDVYSRYAEAQYVGVTAKMVDVVYAFKEILERMGKPIEIQADDEFNNKIFLEFCEKNKIKAYFLEAS